MASSSAFTRMDRFDWKPSGGRGRPTRVDRPAWQSAGLPGLVRRLAGENSGSRPPEQARPYSSAGRLVACAERQVVQRRANTTLPCNSATCGPGTTWDVVFRQQGPKTVAIGNSRAIGNVAIIEATTTSRPTRGRRLQWRATLRSWPESTMEGHAAVVAGIDGQPRTRQSASLQRARMNAGGPRCGRGRNRLPRTAKVLPRRLPEFGYAAGKRVVRARLPSSSHRRRAVATVARRWTDLFAARGRHVLSTLWRAWLPSSASACVQSTHASRATRRANAGCAGGDTDQWPCPDGLRPRHPGFRSA